MELLTWKVVESLVVVGCLGDIQTMAMPRLIVVNSAINEANKHISTLLRRLLPSKRAVDRIQSYKTIETR